MTEHTGRIRRTNIYVYFFRCDQSYESSRRSEETLVHYNIDFRYEKNEFAADK